MAGVSVKNLLDDGDLDFFDVASKAHPDGRTYHVASPSWPDTLRMRRLIRKGEGDFPALDALEDEADREDFIAFMKDSDGNEIGLEEKVFGPALAEMIDDGVPPVGVDRLLALALAHFGINEGTAQNLKVLLEMQTQGEAEAREDRALKPEPKKRTPRKAAPRKSASSPRKAG